MMPRPEVARFDGDQLPQLSSHRLAWASKYLEGITFAHSANVAVGRHCAQQAHFDKGQSAKVKIARWFGSSRDVGSHSYE
jgi:hypothetical protein